MATSQQRQPPISIYAELLPNIQQLSIAVTLRPEKRRSATTSSGTSAATKTAADDEDEANTGPTTVHIDAGGITLLVRHDGHSAALRLPGRSAYIGPPGRAKMELPMGLGKPGLGSAEAEVIERDWRVPLASAAGPRGFSLGRAVAHAAEDAVPWSAVDLTRTPSPSSFSSSSSSPSSSTPDLLAVACRQCGAPLTRSRGADGVVRAWRDLPSEGWAEMMEFWHCHKPTTGGGHGHHGHNGSASGKADEKTLAARGYGANAAFMARRGVGFVDLMGFLLAAEDCVGVTYSHSSFQHGAAKPKININKELKVFCTSCSSQLGCYSPRTEAITLLKWRVLLSLDGHDHHHKHGLPPGLNPPPSAANCLAATLVELAARSGSSKSLIIPRSPPPSSSPSSSSPPSPTTTTQDTVLHLWTLNQNIRFASTDLAATANDLSPSSLPAIKLLYRTVTRAEADAMLQPAAGATAADDVQEVSALPAEAVDEVRAALEESNALFPPRGRTFRGWNVGLLRRWESAAAVAAAAAAAADDDEG